MERGRELICEFVGCILDASHNDVLPGGVGDSTDVSEVDQSELALGLRHEMEHTNDPVIAREIAIDHLTEDPLYYTNLQRFGTHEAFKKAIVDDDAYAEESTYVPDKRKAEVDDWLADMGLSSRRKKRVGSK